MAVATRLAAAGIAWLLVSLWARNHRVFMTVGLVLGASVLATAGVAPRGDTLTDGWERYRWPVPRPPWGLLVVGSLPALAVAWGLGRLQVHGIEFLRLRLGARTLFARRRAHRHRVVIFAAPEVAPWLVDPSAPTMVGLPRAPAVGRRFLTNNANGQLIVHQNLRDALAVAFYTGATLVYGLHLVRPSGINLINYCAFTPGQNIDDNAELVTEVRLLPYIDSREGGLLVAKLHSEIEIERTRLPLFADVFERKK